jgi:ABC-type polar amino acid transport system ATPase subunit
MAPLHDRTARNEDDPTATASIRQIPRGETLIEADKIEVRFSGQPVLHGVTLAVGRGEVVAIIGPSGSGKSTLLRCFNLLQVPHAGQIKIGDTMVFSGHGEQVRSRDLMLLRRKVGMCFQSFNLFPHLTALENVMLAQRSALGRSKTESRERGLSLLERVGLKSRADAKPAQLSGGQQQRVAIARALVKEPKVVLADEPTGSLDSSTATDVVQLLIRAAFERDAAVVLVTHDRLVAEHAHRVVWLRAGRVS